MNKEQFANLVIELLPKAETDIIGNGLIRSIRYRPGGDFEERDSIVVRVAGYRNTFIIYKRHLEEENGVQNFANKILERIKQCKDKWN